MTKYIATVDVNTFDRNAAKEFFGGKVGKGRAFKQIVIIHTERSLEEVESFPGVIGAAPDFVMKPTGANVEIVPSPGGNPGQAAKQTNANWGLKDLSRPYDDAYYYNRGGGGVDIYVMDSGVIPASTEFGSRLYHLYSHDSLSYAAADTHGTSAASCAAGSRCGVAKNADIYSLRIGTDAGFTHVFEGLDTVAYHHWAKSTNHPSVVTMSFGLAYDPTAFNPYWGNLYESTIKEMQDAGIVFVSSAGNESDYGYDWSTGKNPAYLPAGTTGVVAVGAKNPNNTKASFSNIGPYIDIWAPGYQVLCRGNGQYLNRNGTSFAGPYVAGALALVLEGSSKPTNRAQVEQAKSAMMTHLTKSDFPGSNYGASTDKALCTYNWNYWAAFTPLFP